MSLIKRDATSVSLAKANVDGIIIVYNFFPIFKLCTHTHITHISLIERNIKGRERVYLCTTKRSHRGGLVFDHPSSVQFITI